MATLPRGLFNLSTTTLRPLLRPRTINTSILSKLTAQPRPLSTSIARLARPSKPIPKQPRAASSQEGTSYALIKTLASKGSPTTLYEGPSHFWFYFGCWSSGIVILSWTLLTGPVSVMKPLDSEVQWTQYVLGTSYALLAAMGFWLIMKTPGVVSQIRAVPTVAVRAAPIPAATVQPVAKSPSLNMEVTVQRMLPIFAPKILTVPIEKVSLKSRFSLPEEYVPQLRRQELKEEERQKAVEQRKFDMQHLMTLPFRKIGRGFKGLFNGVRSAWTDMGFGTIRVEGKEYKVDVKEGFAHNGFQTLERLVPVKPRG